MSALGGGRAMPRLADACGKEPVATVALQASQVTRGAHAKHIAAFARELRGPREQSDAE